ncbi:hypothetical protein BGZ46_006525, partial [Entomortierella lignicola]
MARLIKPAGRLDIIHLNQRNWRWAHRHPSKFTRVAELMGVAWLDVSTVFRGVPQGRYKIQWSCRLDPQYFPLENTEFRAVITNTDKTPPWDSLIISAVSFTLRNRVQMIYETTQYILTRVPQPNRFYIIQIPDVLIIDEDYKNVLVQFRNHDCSTHKRGMLVEYVRLVREDDPSPWRPPTAEEYRNA